MDSLDRLTDGIEDLRRKCDTLGRDWSAIDITFSNVDGGSPGSDNFNADAYLNGWENLAAVGVTWVHVALPGDSLGHALESIERFRASVLEVLRVA